MREDSRLAFRVGSTVASHGGKEEGAESAVCEEIDDCAHDRGDVRNPAAAYADGDARARVKMRDKIAGHKLATNGSGDVVETSVREVLADWYEHALPILESSRGNEKAKAKTPT